ncbi:MAG: TolC family protein [Elusimicrobiota bacterium]
MLRTASTLTFLLAGAAVFAAAEPPAETYSLERAVKSALDNSAGIQKSAKDIAIAEERVLEAKLRFLPEVGLQATTTRFNARRPFALGFGPRSTLLFPSDKDYLYSGQGYALFSLYEGRRDINTLRLAQTALRQARSQFDTVKLDVEYRAKEAYYRLLLAQKTLTAVDKTLKVTRANAGRASANAWEKVEAAALTSELRSLREEALHHLELARLKFLKALNFELDRAVRVDGELETQPVQVDLRRALVWATELRPELQSQTLRAEMDAIGVNLALSRRYPTVFLGFDYEVTGQEFPLRQNNWDATLGIRLPFSFDFWTKHNQKVAEQRQAEITRSELRDLVHLDVHKAHRALQYWQREWRLREQESQDLLALLEEAQGQNARPAEVLRAAAGVLRAGRRHLEAITAHLLARAQLERAVGRALDVR